MAFLVELSGEHPDLSAADAVGAAEALSEGARVLFRDVGVLAIEAPGVRGEDFARRLALAHAVDAYWFSAAATPRAVVPRFSGVDLEGARFAVRGRRVEGLHPEFPVSDTERTIGHVLKETGVVDLSNPEVEIRLIVAEDAHVGALIAATHRKALDERHVKHRPFFKPVSIAPKFARALLNLARLRAGERVLDPFAGTGGVVLEAGLLGARVLLSDLDARMVVGAKDTLAHYGVTPLAAEARDVGEMPEFAAEHGGLVDVVASDPPYGRSSTTNLEAMDKLYDRFFHAAHAALKPTGRLAVIFPDEALIERALGLFRLRETHALRVHASMTRHFAVLEKA